MDYKWLIIQKFVHIFNLYRWHREHLLEEQYIGVIKEELKSVFYTLKRKITDESDKEMLYVALFGLTKNKKIQKFTNSSDRRVCFTRNRAN